MAIKINQYSNWKHFEERKSPLIKYLIVHSFALSVTEMINILNQYKLAVHYIIDTEGQIVQLVSEDKLAHHAGKSYWNSDENLNEISIGIELQNFSLGQTKFSKQQMESFIILARNIIARYNIKPYNVLGHSDIAPTRKVDPGKSFPWSKLSKYGIGLWTNEISEPQHIDIKELLQTIGYNIEDEKAALYAFIRHFIPSEMPNDEDIYHMEENLLQRAHQMHLINDKILGRLISVAQMHRNKR